MSNPTDGINESNKKLTRIHEQLCCVNSNLESIETTLNVGTAVTLASGPQSDAFGRLRVSEPITLSR